MRDFESVRMMDRLKTHNIKWMVLCVLLGNTQYYVLDTGS